MPNSLCCNLFAAKTSGFFNGIFYETTFVAKILTESTNYILI